jgi:hypothetical protein
MRTFQIVFILSCIFAAFAGDTALAGVVFQEPGGKGHLYVFAGERVESHQLEVTKDTVACRRTTDFKAAVEALGQLDAQWLEENPYCRMVKKGTRVNLIATSSPLSKFCFGPADNCFAAWALNSHVDEAYVPAKVLAKGTLRVCRPEDASDDDYPEDVRIPAGLMFIDAGTVEDVVAQRMNVTAVLTRSGVLKHGTKCTTLPAKLVDEADAPLGSLSAKTLSVTQHRVLEAGPMEGPTGPLPDLPTLYGYVATDFR